MAKIHLIYGRLCSGKTTLAKELAALEKAVVLSCDELMLAIFPEDGLGNSYEEISTRAKEYLWKKAFEMNAAGVNVILDWGFWTKSAREDALSRCRERNIPFVRHLIDIPDEEWHRRIEKRNQAVRLGLRQDYLVDEGLYKKFFSRYEAPSRDEVDAVHHE